MEHTGTAEKLFNGISVVEGGGTEVALVVDVVVSRDDVLVVEVDSSELVEDVLVVLVVDVLEVVSIEVVVRRPGGPGGFGGPPGPLLEFPGPGPDESLPSSSPEESSASFSSASSSSASCRSNNHHLLPRPSIPRTPIVKGD